MRLKLRSIAAKLFYLTTTLVVVTVAGNSLQNAVMFNKHISLKEEETTVDLTKDKAAVLDNMFNHWRTELTIVVRSLVERGSDSERLAELRAYLRADHEIAALALLQEPVTDASKLVISAMTEDANQVNFEGLDAPEVLKSLTIAMPKVLAQKLTANPTRRFLIGSPTQATKLPMILLMLPFTWQDGGPQAKTLGAGRLYWIVMAVWTSRIINVLPKSELTRARLIGDGGEVLASPNPEEVLAAAVPRPGAWAQDNDLRQDYGLKLFKDDAGVAWMGAFAHLSSAEATLLVEKNAKAQHVAADSIIRRSAMWGWGFVLLASLVSFAGSAGLTANLRALSRVTKEIADGKLQVDVNTTGDDEVAELGESVRHMAGRIETLVAEQIAKAHLEKELETAQAVQNALFPKAAMGVPGRLKVVSFYQPASQCGGDWWGWFATGEHSGFLCIGDVTGHGVGAALVTALAYSSVFAATHPSRSTIQTKSPAVILAQLNDLLWTSVGMSTAMTFYCSYFDLEARTMTFANAGHTLPLLWTADPLDDRHRAKRGISSETRTGLKGTPIYLGKGSMPLGITPDSTYHDQNIKLRPGDKLVLYTDGLIECRNSGSECWGKRRLLTAIRDLAAGDADAITQGLRQAAQSFYGAEPLADDVTLLVAEILPVDEAQASTPIPSAA